MKRREALKVMGMGSAAVLASCSTPPSTTKEVKVGTVAEFQTAGTYKRVLLGLDTTDCSGCTGSFDAYVLSTATQVPGSVAAGNVFVVARSLICTHQGCLITNEPVGINLRCPCHSVTFSTQTGEVLLNSGFPNLKALSTVQLAVRGSDVVALLPQTA